jgi:hypothetical protein
MNDRRLRPCRDDVDYVGLSQTGRLGGLLNHRNNSVVDDDCSDVGESTVFRLYLPNEEELQTQFMMALCLAVARPRQYEQPRRGVIRPIAQWQSHMQVRGWNP